jgi:transcriptional regulator with XRE-family HTH domain
MAIPPPKAIDPVKAKPTNNITMSPIACQVKAFSVSRFAESMVPHRISVVFAWHTEWHTAWEFGKFAAKNLQCAVFSATFTNMAKRDRSDTFRNRLTEAMALTGTSRSALARAAEVDRSTIGQILKGDMPRMPNAQLAADVASALGVSTDWLLGLTDRPELPGDIVASAMALSPAERSSADAQLLDWHHEASGYKIRHVPATLPDLLKTRDVIRWEYRSSPREHQEQSITTMRAHLEWLLDGDSDYEIALPIHELEACASGTGYYAGLAFSARQDQLLHISKICTEMFPRLRLSLFDAHNVFSAPITIFGSGLAVIYVGQCYLALRERKRVRALTGHFDWLVKEASVDPRDASQFISSLISTP